MQSTIQQSNASSLSQAKQTQPIVQCKEQSTPAQDLTQANINQPNSVQSPQGLKPAIQAKQRPVQRQTKSTYQSPQGQKPAIQAKQRPVQRQPKQDLKSQMGEQHGVDLSGFKEHQNSAFPGSVGALATIQGKDIHYAPGQFTEQNRKHELGHAIDNTLNGTPKGDKVVNGQNVDTTREKAADKIAETPIQRKKSPEMGNALAQPLESSVVQRATFGSSKENQAYKDRQYTREKDGDQLGTYVGRNDPKMEILQEFAFDLRKQIKDKSGYDVGPHIAVSVLQKNLYVAINTTIPDDENPVPTSVLREQTQRLVQKWSTITQGLYYNTYRAHAIEWLVKAGKNNILAFGAGNEVDKRSLHGEMRILKYMAANVNLKGKHKKDNGQKKVIRLGGIQLDCSDCHQTEHGGINEHGHSVYGNKYGERKSFDEVLAKKGFEVLSPGTHGDAFPGWVHPMRNQPIIRNGKINNEIETLGNKYRLGNRQGDNWDDESMRDYMLKNQITYLKQNVVRLDQELNTNKQSDFPGHRRKIDYQFSKLVNLIKPMYQAQETKLNEIENYRARINNSAQRLGINPGLIWKQYLYQKHAAYRAKAQSMEQKVQVFTQRINELKTKVRELDQGEQKIEEVNNQIGLKAQLQALLTILKDDKNDQRLAQDNFLRDYVRVRGALHRTLAQETRRLDNLHTSNKPRKTSYQEHFLNNQISIKSHQMAVCRQTWLRLYEEFRQYEQELEQLNQQ